MTESEDRVSVCHQLQPLSFDEHLVSQLNIEKRPTVGDSLLATTTDILEVRSDVCGSREDSVTEDGETRKTVAHNVGAACLHHWQDGLQETAADASVEKQADQSSAEQLVSLTDIINNPEYDCAPLLYVLDTGIVEQELKNSGSRSLEENESCRLQAANCEDVIDGPPSCTERPRGVFTDTSIYQQSTVTVGLPCTINVGEYSSSYSTLAAAARPPSVTDDWSSLPVKSVVGGFTEVPAVERASGHDTTQCSSLPLTIPASSVLSYPTHLPSSTSKQMAVAQSIVHPGAAYCLETAGATFEKQAVTEVDENNDGPIAEMSKSSDMAQKSQIAALQLKSTPVHLQTVSIGHILKSILPSSVANDRLMPSAVPTRDRILSVMSPVGHITGTMNDLSIDNSHHPVLRSLLMEVPAPPIAGRDQVTLFLQVLCTPDSIK